MTEQNNGTTQPPGINGMDTAAAKEYLLALAGTVKLTEKRERENEAELQKWNARIGLAKSKGRPELAAEAEAEAERIKSKRQQLRAEINELKSEIEKCRRELPLLASRERSVDPDFLEQELLITAGRLPGDEEKARADRLFSDMEKDAAASAALAELKAKMENKP